MSNLTEKWKQGKLVEGIYYHIKVNGKEIPARLSKYGNFYLTEGACGRNAMRKVEQVLAPVPSYEEWEKLNGGYDWLTLRNKALIEENQKLFSLLFITAKSLQDMADGKIPYTSFGYYAKQILEHIKEQK